MKISPEIAQERRQSSIQAIANANLPDSILASLDYFDGIHTIPLKSEVSKRCNWLLVQGQASDPAVVSAAGWRKVWEDKRPGDRRESDKFWLYHRQAKAKAAAALSAIPVNTPN